MRKITCRVAGPVLFASVVFGIIQGQKTNADDCVAFDTPKNIPCNNQKVGSCSNNIYYKFPYWRCGGGFVFTKVYNGDFGCQSTPPPLPQLYAKCVGATTMKDGKVVPVEAPCVDQDNCVEHYDPLFDLFMCDPAGSPKTIPEQTKTSAACVVG
ncbi:MAG: hypothetical protein K2X87_11835 [Gemmataceae bacterium]|nr:hypothetical protein [Gemmataceae bacterium]